MRFLRAAFALSLSCALAIGAAAFGQTDARADAGDEPMGLPQSGKGLRDRDFGVVSHQFGLDRQVEMYQWRASGDGYTQVWNAAPIDSRGFAPDRQNPPKLPIESRRWWAQDATLDGHPIDQSVLQALGTWRVFRPNFSRLPANLAASFQPEGDGLGSAENPLEPRVGDLRILWRELQLPPLEGKVELRDGRWRLSSSAAQAALSAASTANAVELPADQDRALLPWLLGGATVVVVVGLVWRRVRRRREAAR
ncbi:TMEM43 family protein [Lysobacter auxotrophicus]|uniref:TMEM43 family protein n=1 Tax=Lysobacter auxotrophicus TaxID=2992573 RepID=A0ABM8DFT8_9GAMM|nr:TMEM43 family protein [Lysobacter auxotrophicus]BDU17457.1 TMEM43 family protein [Lysobacter auxotrophicus]